MYSLVLTDQQSPGIVIGNRVDLLSDSSEARILEPFPGTQLGEINVNLSYDRVQIKIEDFHLS